MVPAWKIGEPGCHAGLKKLASPTRYAAIAEVDFPEAKQFGETARQKRRALAIRCTQERLELIFRGCGKGEGTQKSSNDA